MSERHCAKIANEGNGIKIVLVAFLLIFLCSSSSFSQSTNYEKYNANKKSVAGAATLQFFVPGAGNAYAKESIIKVIAYPTLFVGCIASGAIGSTFATSTHDQNVWLFIGVIGAAVTHFIGIADAALGTVDYNEKLRKKYDLVLDQKGIQLVYTF